MGKRAEKQLGLILAGGALLAGLCWLVSSSAHVGGVDLDVFLCHARDMVNGHAPEVDSAYRYFPGVYAFWRLVWSGFAGDTTAVAGAVSAILGLNSLLVATLVWRLTTSLQMGVAAAPLYLCLASRFESLSGTSEPLATIPFLISLLIIACCHPHTWRGMILPGMFLGLCVYVKQQAGLLSLGAAWIVAGEFFARPRSQWQRCLPVSVARSGVLAGVALLTLVLAVLCEGRGLAPFSQGLAMAGGYQAQGGFIHNVYSVIRNDESLVLLAFVGGAGLISQIWDVRREMNEASESDADPPEFFEGYYRLQLTGVMLVAAISGLIQFRTRGYYHYALLIVPSIVVVFAVGLTELVRRFHQRDTTRTALRDSSQNRMLRLMGVLVVAVPFLHAGQRPADLELWEPVVAADDIREHESWGRNSAISGDLLILRDLVPAGARMQVLPPVRASIYLRLKGYQPAGYAFGGPKALSNVDWTATQAVVVVRDRDEREQGNWEVTECDSAILQMESHGLRKAWQGERLELWSRQ